jgi:uncharacterized protein (DUF4415 family)
MNADDAALLASLERGLKQAAAGEYAAVHTPEAITSRRKAGRPVGAVAAVRKQPVTLRFDPDVLAALKSTGRGWQTRVNEVMKEWVAQHAA